MRSESVIRQAIARLEAEAHEREADTYCAENKLKASLAREMWKECEAAAEALRFALGDPAETDSFINQYLGVSNSDADQESVT